MATRALHGRCRWRWKRREYGACNHQNTRLRFHHAPPLPPSPPARLLATSRRQQPASTPQVDLKAALLATAGSVLLMAGVAGAKPIRLAELNAEKAEQLAQQTAVLEYAMRQQETARQAQLAAQ
jgi:hypothetical protein